MNKELLLKVKAHVLGNPEALDMSRWAYECGTVACIAGHVCLMSGVGQVKDDFWAIRALGLLDMPVGELVNAPYDWRVQGQGADWLFYIGEWPREFRDRYFESDILPEGISMAQLVAEVIDYYIANDGKNLDREPKEHADTV